MTTPAQSKSENFRSPIQFGLYALVGMAATFLVPAILPAAIPNDPMFGQQWYLQRIGATSAWETTTGSTEVVVAVFDTGVDYTHPDLASNMWRNPGETGLDANGHDKATNGIDDDANGYVDDVHGVNVWDGTGDPMDTGWFEPPYPTVYHGTGNAGVIGAVGNNSLGVAGVNWSVKIMAIKVITGDLTASPSPLQFFNGGGMLAAWNYVLEMKRRGVNIRVTSHSEGLTAYSPAVRDAIIAAGNEGILTVVAADNNSIDHDQFSTYANVQNLAPILYVAATDQNDRLAWFSDYGKSTVHLAAPGVNILTTTRGGGYTTLSGTSFACPMVAGAAALVLAARPQTSFDSLSAVEYLKAVLMSTVDPLPGLQGKVMTGGRLNLYRAVNVPGRFPDRPFVVTALPAGQRTPMNSSIQVTFAGDVNRKSVEDAFVITPPISGTFEWPVDDSDTFKFWPDTPFDPKTNYTVRILGSAYAEDRFGMAITLDGNFNGISEGSPADDFVWTFRFPVSNDNFANAQVLTGRSGNAFGTTHHTDYEDGEPTQGTAYDPYLMASVWYRWTGVESNEWTTFELTGGTAFDSYLAVYEGPELTSLKTVAINDNYGTRQTSRVSFRAVGGGNYWISVIGKSWQTNTKSGPFTLSWYPTPPPVITSFTPSTAYPGQKLTLNGTDFTGVTSVLFNGVPAVFQLATNANFGDLQLTVTVPVGAVSGPITIETPHGTVTSTDELTALPLPVLSIRPVPGTSLVELSWPSTSGFTLQRSETFSPTGSWTAFSITTVLTNGMRMGTTAIVSSNRFFRLRNSNL